MVDNISKIERSAIMSKVRSKNTRPEMVLRKALFALGLRYRLHKRSLPGCPDIVFARQRIAVEIRGCFWHRHDCRKRRKIPDANHQYWRDKLEKNAQRDRKNEHELKALGWDLIVVWECEISKQADVDMIANRIAEQVRKKS